MGAGVQWNERPEQSRGALNFSFREIGRLPSAMAEEVLTGLRQQPKAISPKYFYDTEGSRLFSRICELSEYYPTRAEEFILRHNASSIARRLGRDISTVEFGAGDCQKACILLETGAVAAYVPIDISRMHLRRAALRVAGDFPELSVRAIAVDFIAQADRLPDALPAWGKRLLFYAGSSIGNFEPSEAIRLLRTFHDLALADGGLLIGFDLKKDVQVLERAYNDAHGVTAAFNLNVLARLNRELDANFDLTGFRHVAYYNSALGRIEMHLESVRRQRVELNGETVELWPHERIHTENSYKYSVEEFDGLAAAAGFARREIWTDPRRYFAVGLYSPAR